MNHITGPEIDAWLEHRVNQCIDRDPEGFAWARGNSDFKLGVLLSMFEQLLNYRMERERIASEIEELKGVGK